jgi:flagellar hook-associated protein 3 FlgL
MRISTNMMTHTVLGDLNRASERMAATSRQISSGQAIAKPSDDPFGVSKALKLQQSLDGVRQYQSNIDDATGWSDATETALGTITSNAQRARDLIVQASNDTGDAANRGATADEIDAIIAEMKQTANASYNGRFIMGGVKTDAPPYQDGANDAYGGATTTISRQIGPSVSVSVGVTADQVLGSGGGDDKLIAVLRNASAHLRAGDTTTLRGSDLAKLDTALDGVLAVRADNGARTNRLDAAASRLQDIEQTTLTALTNTTGTDYPQAIMDQNAQTAAYQAALRVGATLVQSSLMDFLK